MADARGAGGTPLPPPAPSPHTPLGPRASRRAIKARGRQCLPGGQGEGRPRGHRQSQPGGWPGGDREGRQRRVPAQQEKPLARSECQQPGPSPAAPQPRARGPQTRRHRLWPSPSSNGANRNGGRAEAQGGQPQPGSPSLARGAHFGGQHGPRGAAHTLQAPRWAPAPLSRFCPISLPPLPHRPPPGMQPGAADGRGPGAVGAGDLLHTPIKGFFQRGFYTQGGHGLLRPPRYLPGLRSGHSAGTCALAHACALAHEPTTGVDSTRLCKSRALQRITGGLAGREDPLPPPRRWRLTESCSEPPVLPSPRTPGPRQHPKSRPGKQTGEGVAFVAVIFVLFAASL